MNRWNTEDFYDSENILYDIMMDTRHCTLVQTHKMHTWGELSVWIHHL